MHSKNILVLGGDGYLGSKVVRHLLCTGNKVVCTKRDITRVNYLYDEKNVTFIPASVDAFSTLTQYYCIDVILNMACNYGRSLSLYDSAIEANIWFPLQILNQATKSKIKRFITIGTGLPKDFNMYSYSKGIFADFGKFYTEKHNLDFSCLKLEMFYGADEPQNRFIPATIRKCIIGEDIQITPGKQKRDIISVDDVVTAISVVIDADLHGYYEIPIGTGIGPTISELIDFIWEKTNRQSKISKGELPNRQHEPDSVANTEILTSLCTWQPIFWKDGIQQMIKTIKLKLQEAL